MHHYELGEASDPDLLERNAHSIRESKKMPLIVKYMNMFGLMLMWKWFYYAPNTVRFSELHSLSVSTCDLRSNLF